MMDFQPIPSEEGAETIPATSYLYQVFDKNQLNFTLADCGQALPHTFKYELVITGVTDSFTGECKFVKY